MLKSIKILIFEKIVECFDLINQKKIKEFFKKNLKNKIVVFDIGAHKGETINFFLKYFDVKKIYCFEPNNKIFRNLKEKYNISKIKLFNVGVGDKNERKLLNIYNDSFSSSFNSLNKKSDYFKRKSKIIVDNYIAKKSISQIKTLNSIIDSEKIKKIDILKIDTEGYEYKILKNITKKNFNKIRFIYFEHHFNLMLIKKYKYKNIRNLLKKNNFEISLKIKMIFRKNFEYIYKNKNFNEN